MDGSLTGKNEVAPRPVNTRWKICCYWVSLIKTKNCRWTKIVQSQVNMSHINGWCVTQILSMKGNERTQAASQVTLHQQRRDCTQECWHHSLVCRSMSKIHLQQAMLWNTRFVQERFVVNILRMQVNTINCWVLILWNCCTTENTACYMNDTRAVMAYFT